MSQRPTPAPGTNLSHYQLVDRLGEGGMGVVFRAVDTRLNRTVALKVISEVAIPSAEQRHRFLREARAASAFNHPNIVTIHEVDEADAVDFIVMELVAGRSLAERIPKDGLPIDAVIDYARQIVSALETAHTSGVVHRDIKPANVMVTESGQVKVLDFGIAKLLTAPFSPDEQTMSITGATEVGVVVGSVAYMSPEQVQGRPVSDRSDVFAFGILLYEMLTGARPFGGTTTVETMAKILEAEPPDVASLRRGVPADLTALITGCLDKDPARRPSAHDLATRLETIRQSRTAPSPIPGGVVRRRTVALVAAAAAAVVLGGAGLWWASGAEERAARARVSEVVALAERYDYEAFYRAASDVLRVLPDEPQVNRLWTDLTAEFDATSEPDGAEVAVKPYSSTADWILLGRTPIKDLRVPFGPLRVRVSKDGYVPVHGTMNNFIVSYKLDRVDEMPEGMVRIPAIRSQVGQSAANVPEYLLDRYEVTNQQFKQFVDAGGYQQERYWTMPFVDERGSSLSFKDAIALFRDRTGRPGPATWELGNFPDGQADFPVSGVSWYEAAAYAAFAGKSLPTAFQWKGAVAQGSFATNFTDMLNVSNFGLKGPVRIGTHEAVNAFGAADMAGNVKEWCWNEAEGGRMILGGGFDEPAYMYNDLDAQAPIRRLRSYGMRLAKTLTAQPAESYARIERASRDYSRTKPLDDTAFAVLKNLYAYDPLPLDARVEGTEDAPGWRKETVSIAAAYGGERIPAYLYLPTSATPPYQTVVYFPGGDASVLPTSRNLRLLTVDFVIRSGRAVVFPIYKGTYERRVPITGVNTFRDVMIARGKDFGRVLDYIATRPDLDKDRVGFYGISLGAFAGQIFTAIEPRVKASVLLGGGLPLGPVPAEVDMINFVPRITVPTLMVNGRNDFSFPLEASQRPLFDHLTLPPGRKRHALFEGGHLPGNLNDVIREILDWFDTYLGPLRSAP